MGGENALSRTYKNGVELSSVENNVKSPKHYRLEGLNIESIDVIRATLGKEGFKSFCKGEHNEIFNPCGEEKRTGGL